MVDSVYKPPTATRPFIRRRQRERRTCVHIASTNLGFPVRQSGFPRERVRHNASDRPGPRVQDLGGAMSDCTHPGLENAIIQRPR